MKMLTIEAIEAIAALGPCQSYLGAGCARLRALFDGRSRVAVRTGLRRHAWEVR